MKISIITINYNNADGLRRTIASVVAQTYLEKEYIIIDGYSTDGSQDEIKKHEEKIAYWISEPDSGIYNAMNKGIRQATGDYCIFMNSGDVFFSPTVLLEASAYLKSGKDIYNGNSVYLKNRRISWYRKGNRDNSIPFFYRTSICHQASFIKTSLLKDIEYDESLKIASDWKFWLVACRRHSSFEAIDVNVCCFEVGGISSNKDIVTRERKRVLDELLSPEEIALYEADNRKNKLLKYIKSGFIYRFWLYYARALYGKTAKLLWE